jgi:hypothetical protein
MRDEAKKLVANGDRSSAREEARADCATAIAFEAVAQQRLVKCERDGLAPVTIQRISWLLAKPYPMIGSIPLAQITPHEALAVLREIEATGACAACSAGVSLWCSNRATMH